MTEDNRKETLLSADPDCEISLHESSGLELSCCNMSQPCTSPSDTDGVQQQQASRQGYRQLFFDCKLHLVLQQLLSKSKAGRPSKSANPASDGALLETQSDPEAELSDTEVARLMRQHLNILISSQNATKAEVVKAAKILEQRFLQPEITAAHSTKTEEQTSTATPSDWDLRPPASADHGERASLKASQAIREKKGNCPTPRPACTPESPASDTEHNITGLRLSQTQDAQIGCHFSASEGLAESTRFSAPQGEEHSADMGEEPRKKLCRGVFRSA